MAVTPNDFDLLDEWALLPDSQLADIITKDSCATLNRILHLLRDVGPGDELVNEENFASLVRELRQAKHEGSHLLGEAILRVADLRETGNSAEANRVLEAFANTTKSPFYRRIALNYRT